METLEQLIDSTDARHDAFVGTLNKGQLHERTPAAFASAAHETTGPKYAFLSTERVLDALMQAGFVAVGAAQTRTRRSSPFHARHAIRLRRRLETVQLTDSIPEIVFINGHDGRTAVQFRLGLFRVVCTNGLIVSIGAVPVWRVSHRGDLLEAVVRTALAQSELFSQVGAYVQRMERTRLDESQRMDFAQRALALRFPGERAFGMQPSQLLTVRREEDVGNDLWRTYNVIQENVLKGGLSKRAPSNRLTRTRGITAIREEVRLNSGLWDMATALAA